MGMEKSTQSSSHKWKAWDYDFRFSAALTAWSVSLQSPNILGVRMTVLICYCNPSSGRRYSSCQWQLDIRWTQGTTLKWEERIINDRWKKKWWKKCFWQNKCRDVYIYNFKWKKFKIQQFGFIKHKLYQWNNS